MYENPPSGPPPVSPWRRRSRTFARWCGRILLPAILVLGGYGLFQFVHGDVQVGRVVLESTLVGCLIIINMRLLTRMPSLNDWPGSFEPFDLGWHLSVRGTIIRYRVTSGSGAFMFVIALLVWNLQGTASWLHPFYKITEWAMWISIVCLIHATYARTSMFTAKYPNVMIIPGEIVADDTGYSSLDEMLDVIPVTVSAPANPGGIEQFNPRLHQY